MDNSQFINFEFENPLYLNPDDDNLEDEGITGIVLQGDITDGATNDDLTTDDFTTDDIPSDDITNDITTKDVTIDDVTLDVTNDEEADATDGEDILENDITTHRPQGLNNVTFSDDDEYAVYRCNPELSYPDVSYRDDDDVSMTDIRPYQERLNFSWRKIIFIIMGVVVGFSIIVGFIAASKKKTGKNFISSVLPVDGKREPHRKPGHILVAKTFQGTWEIVEGHFSTYHSAYSNPSSKLHQQLSFAFISTMKNIFKNSLMASVYDKTKIDFIRPGSVILQFQISLTTPIATESNDVKFSKDDLERTIGSHMRPTSSPDTKQIGEFVIKYPIELIADSFWIPVDKTGKTTTISSTPLATTTTIPSTVKASSTLKTTSSTIKTSTLKTTSTTATSSTVKTTSKSTTTTKMSTPKHSKSVLIDGVTSPLPTTTTWNEVKTTTVRMTSVAPTPPPLVANDLTTTKSSRAEETTTVKDMEDSNNNDLLLSVGSSTESSTIHSSSTESSTAQSLSTLEEKIMNDHLYTSAEATTNDRSEFESSTKAINSITSTSSGRLVDMVENTTKTETTTTTTTTTTTAPPCPGGFQCPSASRIICKPMSDLCDGIVDCPDSFDEQNCGTRCSNGGFRCRSANARYIFLGGKCTPPGAECNSQAECSDASDELHCPCPAGQFRCVNGIDRYNGDRCIPPEFKCDRDNDCMDNSDEVNCVYSCAANQFKCETGAIAYFPLYGFCIPRERRCDGYIHCQDQSDEANCNGTCSADSFRCVNPGNFHSCVPNDFVCDKDNDCADGSDEVGCDYTCPVGQWPCQSSSIFRPQFDGFCIHNHERCNGLLECRDFSDEMGCRITCHGNEFRCTSGHDVRGMDSCIPAIHRCDRHIDCSDNSDETGCTYACEVHEFKCAAGPLSLPGQRGYCLPLAAVCDNKPQCEDASDEEGCPATCPIGTFQCPTPEEMTKMSSESATRESGELTTNPTTSSPEQDVTLIPNDPEPHNIKKRSLLNDLHLLLHWSDKKEDPDVEIINETDDLSDIGSHESGSSKIRSKRIKRTLDDPVCLNVSLVCDGVNDCPAQNGTFAADELECERTCPPGMLPCSEGIIARWPHRGFCIYETEVCDGYHDCVSQSDESSCENVTCPPGHVSCNGGHDIHDNDYCIEDIYQCDKIADCSNSFDETGCNYTCEGGMFECRNGTVDVTKNVTRGFCLFKKYLCDKIVHCIDGSDEENCDSCPAGMMSCHDDVTVRSVSHKCIPLSWQCNGILECENGRDEADCRIGSNETATANDSVCNENEAKCIHGYDITSGGQCIPLDYVCDAFTDCSSGSDEYDCNYECPEGQSPCLNGTISAWPHRGYCVPDYFLCNTIVDCTSKSDEQNCTSVCGGDDFICTNGLRLDGYGSCVSTKDVCNGEPQCKDRSDELHCADKCSDNQTTCNNGSLAYTNSYCLDYDQLCDNFIDCTDRSDELNCNFTSCPNGTFSCGHLENIYGDLCIGLDLVCDNVPHCYNHADEKFCSLSCTPGYLSCTEDDAASNGTNVCFPVAARCDNIYDCLSYRDEELC